METINLSTVIENVAKITKVPKPLDGQVLILNPFYGKDDEMTRLEKELERMPEKDRDEFRKKNFYEIWHHLIVIGVGDQVKDLKAGDEVVSTATEMASAIVLCDEKYLLTRRGSIKAKW